MAFGVTSLRVTLSFTVLCTEAHILKQTITISFQITKLVSRQKRYGTGIIPIYLRSILHLWYRVPVACTCNRENQQESQTKTTSQGSFYFNSCHFGIQRGTKFYTYNCNTYLTKKTQISVQCRNRRCPAELLIDLINFTNIANHIICFFCLIQYMLAAYIWQALRTPFYTWVWVVICAQDLMQGLNMTLGQVFTYHLHDEQENGRVLLMVDAWYLFG